MSGLRWLLRASLVGALLITALMSSCCCLDIGSDDPLIIEPNPIPPIADLQVTGRTVSDATGFAPFAVTFDASGSSDPDGTIVRYDWDFDNDGTFDLLDGGVTEDYDYPTVGVYTARVMVTDNDGLTDDDTTTINVNPVLVPPVAAGTAAQQGTTTVANFNGSTSTDSDGTIVTYDWDFDNNGTYELLNGGVSPTHDYGAYGSFTAGLRVTDNDGLSDDTDIPVTLTEPLVPPVAAGVAAQDGITSVANFDGSTSTDADGTIVTYDWDFDNDGTYDLLNGGVSPVHDYGAFGDFVAGLRVTDDDGLTDETDIPVTLVQPLAPVAALTPTPASGTANPQVDVVWDASASTDADGTIVSFDWDMDNDTVYEILNGGPTQNASYTTSGIHTVGVRVTDNDGLTDETTNTVDINTPPVADLIPTPPNGNKPLLVNWSAAGSTDADGTIVSFDWDMDNDTVYEIIGGGTTQPATYPNIGTFTVGVRVTDDDGATDETTASVTVTGTPPVADLTGIWAGDPQFPFEAFWDATGSTDVDGVIVTYDWDWENDGIIDLPNGGPTQTHDYGPSGSDITVTCRVVVTDDDGFTDETTTTITLFAPPG